MSNPPSVTLYITNINDKVKKEELRRNLYALFSVYGKVLDVVHTRSPKTRGTAFVVFRDLASSTSALRGLDGEGFFGKQLRISYAKGVSHATIAQAEGPEAVYAIKLGLRTAAEKKKAGQSKMTVSAAQKKAADEARGKRAREENGAEAEHGETPNPILFVEGLPVEVTADMLLPLFQQYPGLSSLKLLPTPSGSAPNAGLAFVQYETAGQAGTAREALNEFLLAPQTPMKVGWAKRA
ncbi:hypothetical protein BCR35DRAFT_260775 [Leucosporidium creatinivorum]|uniref:RRM domain-containing protein n=1 Tax=Leucosporidium creatinivorum TaxID=106004 RepID=A0A1Y2G2P1_9BASI|nr:hypothetical protein BCR35DRAFT_260775 [Leucosporidium creatinivorum]